MVRGFHVSVSSSSSAGCQNQLTLRMHVASGTPGAASPRTGPGAGTSPACLSSPDSGPVAAGCGAAEAEAAISPHRERRFDCTKPTHASPVEPLAKGSYYSARPARLAVHQAQLPWHGPARRGDYARSLTPKFSSGVARRRALPSPGPRALRHRPGDGQHHPGRVRWEGREPARLSGLSVEGHSFIHADVLARFAATCSFLGAPSPMCGIAGVFDTGGGAP